MEKATSLGLKTQANYATEFSNNVSWQSNFSSFLSYKNKDQNYWVYSTSISKAYKYVGIGLDMSFKKSKQEAIARGLETNPLQWFYVLGLSYKY